MTRAMREVWKWLFVAIQVLFVGVSFVLPYTVTVVIISAIIMVAFSVVHVYIRSGEFPGTRIYQQYSIMCYGWVILAILNLLTLTVPAP